MCQFSLPYSGDSSGLINRAKMEITSRGGSLQGDDMQGRFHAKTPIGSIEGTYQVSDQFIHMHITRKPFLLSCNRIQKELTGLMR